MLMKREKRSGNLQVPCRLISSLKHSVPKCRLHLRVLYLTGLLALGNFQILGLRIQAGNAQARISMEEFPTYEWWFKPTHLEGIRKKVVSCSRWLFDLKTCSCGNLVVKRKFQVFKQLMSSKYSFPCQLLLLWSSRFLISFFWRTKLFGELMWGWFTGWTELVSCDGWNVIRDIMVT